MGGVIGLDYAGCAVVLGRYGLDDPEVWTGLRVVEQQFIRWASEQAESARNLETARRGRGPGLL